MPGLSNSANFLFQIFNAIGQALLQFSKFLCSTVYSLPVISLTRTLVGWSDVPSLINAHGSIPALKTLPGKVFPQTLPRGLGLGSRLGWVGHTCLVNYIDLTFLCSKSTVMHSLWFMLSTLQETVVVVISEYWFFYNIARVEVVLIYLCLWLCWHMHIYVYWTCVANMELCIMYSLPCMAWIIITVVWQYLAVFASCWSLASAQYSPFGGGWTMLVEHPMFF